MNLETIASIDLVGGVRAPRDRFFVQAKLPGDGQEHPYGQWSLAVVPLGFVGEAGMIASIDFVAPDAPREKLIRGLKLDLFRGTSRVGSAVVMHAAPAGGRDRDFLSTVHEPPRHAEAA